MVTSGFRWLLGSKTYLADHCTQAGMLARGVVQSRPDAVSHDLANPSQPPQTRTARGRPQCPHCGPSCANRRRCLLVVPLCTRMCSNHQMLSKRTARLGSVMGFRCWWWLGPSRSQAKGSMRCRPRLGRLSNHPIRLNSLAMLFQRCCTFAKAKSTTGQLKGGL